MRSNDLFLKSSQVIGTLSAAGVKTGLPESELRRGVLTGFYECILTINMATKQAMVVFQSPLAVAEAFPTRTL